MISSLRKFLLTAVIITLLHSNAPAGDLPTPETCIEVEIEREILELEIQVLAREMTHTAGAVSSSSRPTSASSIRPSVR